MEYICDKIISQRLKIYIYTSKLGLWVKVLGKFFMVNGINIYD